MEEEMVTIRTFRTPWEAHVAKARLEEDGIACVIDDEDAATVFGSALAFASVKLKVPQSQSERADEILLEIEDAAQEEGEDDGQ
jgi:hypothetical protein